MSGKKEMKNQLLLGQISETLEPLCSDTSSVDQRPSSQETEEDLDANESHEGEPTTPTSGRETTDDPMHVEVTTESPNEPGIPEVPEFNSDASVSADIMEAMSEAAAPDNWERFPVTLTTVMDSTMIVSEIYFLDRSLDLLRVLCR